MVKKNQKKLTAKEKRELRLKGINLPKIKRNFLKELYNKISRILNNKLLTNPNSS